MNHQTLALEAKHLVKVYEMGHMNLTAVKNVSLEIPSKKFTVFIGPSGCGKTTLLNMFGTIDVPTSGTLKVSGKNVLDKTDAELSLFRAQEIGFIFQVFNLIAVLSVFDNVAYPLRLCRVPEREIQEKVFEMLKAVGMEKFYKNRPNELSGGQRQRVAIARALVNHPSLVLADEPTANLDSQTSLQILELMRNLCDRSKVTFVFCTHDPVVLEYANLIFKMKDGEIIDRKNIDK